MGSPWFIYTLTDPREPDVVRYVGWTKDVWGRHRSHLRRARSEKTPCGAWKRCLLADGFEPLLTVIEAGTGRGWEEAERAWISHYRAVERDRLLNVTAGGGGVLGHRWKLSEETREKIRRASRKRGFSDAARAKAYEVRRGVPLTPEHRAKLSAAHRGSKKSPEAIEKTAAFWRDRKHSEETRAKIRASHAKLQPPKEQQKAVIPEKTREKIRASLQAYYAKTGGGRKHSPEAKARISAKLKAYRARVAAGVS